MGELTDWLRNTGKDIAKAAGKHIAERGLAYAKDALGAGVRAELEGKAGEQSGDGVEDWLKHTGREVARAVGSHLKSMAKDKAVALAKQHLGAGIADEMSGGHFYTLQGEATRKGKHAHVHARNPKKVRPMPPGLSRGEGVASSLRSAGASALKAVGKAALAAGKDAGEKQLQGLAKKYFGGAGTPEQAVRVCAYTLSTLRKIITQKRRHVAGLSPNDYLSMHAHRLTSGGEEEIARFREMLAKRPAQGGAKMVDKRRMIREIKTKLHPPVSKLSRARAVEYIFGTAREMGWDWEPLFEQAPERKRVPKGCYRMRGPGPGRAQPKDTGLKVAGPKRKPSAYNDYMRATLADPSFFPGMPYGGVSGRFAKAARRWKDHKATIADSAAASADRAAFRASPAGRMKIPKKKKNRG